MGLIDRRRAIVLFGDSLTQRSFEPSGWGAALAHLYGRRCDVYNRGFGGYNTRWCRSMVGELFPAHETPLLATVLLGTNDAALFDVEPAAHVPLEEYEDNLTAIVTHVKKRCVHVIVLTPPCMDERQRLAFQKEKYGADALGALDRRNANTKRYAEVATRVAETLDVPCVDLFEATWKACASSSTRSDGVSRQNSVDPWGGAAAAAAADGNERRVARRLRRRRALLRVRAGTRVSCADGRHSKNGGQRITRVVSRVVRPRVHGLGLAVRPDPARRARGVAGRDVRARARARVSPTLLSAETKARGAWRVDGHDVDAAVASSAKTGLAALAVVAGAGLGLGYALGLAARR